MSRTVTFTVLFIGVFGWKLSSGKSLEQPQNCRTLYDSGETSSGVYEIDLSGQKYNVLCDQELDGGGWTVIQQRLSGDEHFWNRTWEEYKQGFGKLSKDSSFYSGNQLINLISNQFKTNMTLRVELHGDRNPESTHTNDFYFAEYFFRLNDESTDYTLKINMPYNQEDRRGNASNAWYDITYSNEVKFSTLDHINDPMPECQQDYHLGGWWTHYCSLASLNGEYVPLKWGGGYGFFFTIWGRYAVNPVKTRMLLRDRRSES